MTAPERSLLARTAGVRGIDDLGRVIVADGADVEAVWRYYGRPVLTSAQQLAASKGLAGGRVAG